MQKTMSGTRKWLSVRIVLVLSKKVIHILSVLGRVIQFHMAARN